MTRAQPRTRFTLAPELSATAPPEARGLARDEVRLLVARPRRPIRHSRFTDLPAALAPGDLLVVNDSDTEPAAVDGHRTDGRPAVLHVSGPADHGLFVVELRDPAGGRVHDARTGEDIRLPAGVTATLVAAHPDRRRTTGSRLWLARIPVEGGVRVWLHAVGRPIAYSYLRGSRPLADYRTLFARPGGGFASAEMPSAARPFTTRVVAELRAAGVQIAQVTLHTGVSSLEADEVPLPERFDVPAESAALVNAARRTGSRVVAVGTTATRAVESAAGSDGVVRTASGWTDLVLGPDRPVRVVDGLLTGWHEPQASHLLLLEAVAGARLVERAYRAALAQRYRWHEFGDACLLLPDRAG